MARSFEKRRRNCFLSEPTTAVRRSRRPRHLWLFVILAVSVGCSFNGGVVAAEVEGVCNDDSSSSTSSSSTAQTEETVTISADGTVSFTQPPSEGPGGEKETVVLKEEQQPKMTTKRGETEHEKPKQKQKTKKKKWKTGTLRPSDLPVRTIFDDFHSNGTWQSPVSSQQQQQPLEYAYRDGTIPQINRVVNKQSFSSVNANVTLLQSALPRSAVEQVLELLRNYSDYDEDPDTVDGMPTYEIFVDSIELRQQTKEKSIKKHDTDPKKLPARKKLRQKLQSILVPYLNTVLTPFVRQKYPEQCNSTQGRACTPCYSLIRRYRHGERQSHAAHHDGHARVTVVTSLSDYGVDYLGGLYVSTGFGQQQFLQLNAGDAAIHQSNVLHGVRVDDLPPPRSQQTERWSWIVWFRDSETCEDHSLKWFQQCAEVELDAICQLLHATKIIQLPGYSEQQLVKKVLDLNLRAAHGGSGQAAVKIARAYLRQLPNGDLPLDIEQAKKYFQMAIQSHNPDGHYGTAQILLAHASAMQKQQQKNRIVDNDDEFDEDEDENDEINVAIQALLKRVLRHLEEAAYLGHAYSMFNLGIAHVYGYGCENNINMALGAQWFVASGLPEGYMAAAHYAQSIGHTQQQRIYEQRAKTLGYYQPWRKMARERTGSGGAAGVDLNLPWPDADEINVSSNRQRQQQQTKKKKGARTAAMRRPPIF